MDLKILEEIGLTEGETKVYLALLRLGMTKTGKLAKKAGVSSSKVYKILDRLEIKGLAGHIIKGGVKYYRAMGPNRVLDYIDEKQDQLAKKKEIVKKLIPELELESKLSKEKAESVFFEGLKAIKNFFNGVLDELSKGEEFYVLGANYGEDYRGLRSFFNNFHLRRAKKGIKVKMIASAETKGNLVPATFVNAEIRFFPKDIETKMDVIFYKNKAMIIFLTKDPKGFLLESREVVEGFKQYMDVFWELAKK